MYGHDDSSRHFAGDHGDRIRGGRACRVRTIRHDYRREIDDASLMARSDDGRLLVVWSNGGESIRGAWSHDHGRTWSAPVRLLTTSTGHDYDPSVVISGKRILVTATVTAGTGIGASTTKCVRSDDRGRTWSPPYDIPMHHRYTCGKTHHGLRLKSGRLLMGYSWDLFCEKGRTLQSEGQMHLRRRDDLDR